VREFEEDGSDRPHIDGGRVDLAAKEDLGGTIPQRHNLVCVRL